MLQVKKRDGSLVDFNLNKIAEAMRKAFIAENVYTDENILGLLTLKVIADFSKKVIDNTIPVEDIQDSVETVLIKADFDRVAKAYILYRQNHEKLREMKNTVLDYKSLVDSYVNVEDWRVKENSTVTYSVGGLILNNSGAITANYWLSEIYDKEIADAHKNADMHIHDLSMLTGYCFTGDTVVWSLDGRNKTFKELVDEKTSELWVFAFDKKNNRIVPAKAINPRITRTTKELSYVYLTDGTVVKSTPDHLFMTRDGNFVAAKDLKPNTSLMPLYVGNKSKYCSINDAWHTGHGKMYLHRWVVEQITGDTIPRGWVVHHKNGDKHDNRPENLELMKSAAHRSAELKKTMQSELWKRENAKRLREYNQSSEKRNSVSAFAQRRSRTANGRFAPSSFQYVPSKDSAGQYYNHCVRKVETITLEEAIPVYDLTVSEYENFAVADGIFVHNCAGWSLRQLIEEGLGGVPGKITSAPARHLSTLCNQMVNFLGIMQNEWAGAQAFSSFDTYLAPFVKVDNLSYKEVKNAIQSFVFGVNTPSRWGTQAPFSNITLDWVCPDDLAVKPAIVGGKEMDFTYGDCKTEMDMVNKAFLEIMIEGDANGRGFQYPIPTYSITKDFDWSETENNKLLFEMTAKYGTPYFSNYVNSDMEPSDIRSMCCRLRLDLRELRKKSGGFFGSGESTGSVGVVTINMPRIAYLAKDEEDFFNRLDKLMDIAARSLKVKRDVITKFLEDGLYPYTKRYLGTFKNHFSTIGLIGMNEVGLNANWLQMDMTHPETQNFTVKVLNHLRERLSDYQEMYGDLYNLEATPAESTTYRLAKHDKKRYPDIITANMNGTPYYTNSSHLPVGYTEDVFSALDIQDELQTLYTSGTVFHAFLGEKLPDWKAAATLVRKIAENYKLPYYTMSPTYSICPEHGYLAGEQTVCPHCGNKTEVYSRITGYYRPVQNWNDGKAQEYKDRKVYNIEHSVLRKKTADCTDSCPVDIAGAATEKTEEDIFSEKTGIVLYATETCPNCKLACQWLDKAGIFYVKKYVSQYEDEARKIGIKQAPTLCVFHDGYCDRYSGVANIKKYIMEVNK